MPSQMKCPHCQSPLTITPELYGQMVRCPPCGATLKVPTPQQSRPTGKKSNAPRKRPSAPRQAPTQSANPLDFHSPAPPPPQGHPQQQAQGARPPEDEERLPHPWSTIRGGALFVMLGALLIALGISISIVIQEFNTEVNHLNVMTSWIFGSLLPGQPPYQLSEASTGALWTFYGLTLTGLALTFLGMLMLGAIPRLTSAKGLLSLSTFFMLLAVVSMIIGRVMDQESEEKYVFLGRLFNEVGAGLFLATGFLFLLFLYQMGHYLNNAGIRTSVTFFGMFLIGLPVIVRLITASTIWAKNKESIYALTLASKVTPVAISQTARTWSMIGAGFALLWFFWILYALWSGVKRAHVRGRLEG